MKHSPARKIIALLALLLLPLWGAAQTPPPPVRIYQIPSGTINGATVTFCDTLTQTFICSYTQVAAVVSTNLSTIQITGGGTGATTATGALDNLLPAQGAFAGDCLGTNGSSASWIACGSGGGGGGSGTVTSVGLGMPAQFIVTGSPVTGAGNFTVAFSGVPMPVGVGGTGAPSLTGPLVGNGTSAIGSAAASDIYGLWSGCGSSTVWLNGLGGCTAPSGSGTVNSASSGSFAYYASTGTVVSGAGLGGNLAFVSGVLETSQAINAQSGTTYTFVAGDAGKLVTFSNGAPVAASLPQAGTTGFTSGFSIDVQDLGSGSTTITPVTSTINSGATLVIPQNSGCTITSDGTNYQVSACTALSASSSFTPINIQTFSSGTANWTKPGGTPKDVWVRCFGGGGGGGSGWSRSPPGTAASGGAGGGGGGMVEDHFAAASLSSTVSITIGVGGTAGAATSGNGNGNSGGVGGSTTFGSLLTAYGGGGGQGGAGSACGKFWRRRRRHIGPRWVSREVGATVVSVRLRLAETALMAPMGSMGAAAVPEIPLGVPDLTAAPPCSAPAGVLPEAASVPRLPLPAAAVRRTRSRKMR